MNTKPKTPSEPAAHGEHGRFWLPQERRDGVSEQGRKWIDENAESIKSMNEWVEKNGLPLAIYRQF